MLETLDDFYTQDLRVDLVAASQLADLNLKHTEYLAAAARGAFVVSVLQGACSQVKHPTSFAFEQPFKALDVGIDQIHHMDIVTHTGAVRRGIIRPVVGQGVPFAGRGFDHHRDQAGFGLVPFTYFGFNVGARNVEIPEHHRLKAVALSLIHI